ncbi:MAG: adenosylhomocysteinase [Acidobacteriaceae bacterium]|nr:adenosylhomocysteinase [Acidobacteriaceae bacterium]
MSKSRAPSVPCDVKDPALAESGKARIEWAFHSMSVLQHIRKQFIKTQPFREVRIAFCGPITPESANLAIALRDGGGEPWLCASDARSTHDDVAASLVRDYHMPVFAFREESSEALAAHAAAILQPRPQLLIDEGCRLTQALQSLDPEFLPEVIGAIESDQAGVDCLRALSRKQALPVPVISQTGIPVKDHFAKRYGTAESVVGAIAEKTNVLLAGLTAVIAGFGEAGRAIAAKLREAGAHVIVTEVDAVRALEATMEGYRVMTMADAAALADLAITVTGNRSVIGRDHFDKFKNGAILCNAGCSAVEIDVEALRSAAMSRRECRDSVDEFSMRDGRKLFLLSSGEPLVRPGEGYPSAVQDIAFAIQALSAEYLIKRRSLLEKAVHPVPADVGPLVAKIKLESMGLKIDRLTVEQEQYLGIRLAQAAGSQQP